MTSDRSLEERIRAIEDRLEIYNPDVVEEKRFC